MMDQPAEYIEEEITSVPHNLEAEKSLVGSILIDPFAFGDASVYVKADDFYIHRLRFVWEAFESLIASLSQIDLLTVADVLARKDQLVEIGGPAFLTALVNQVPTSLHAERYAKLVREYSARRKMLETANRIAIAAWELERPFDETIAIASQEQASIDLLSMANHNMRPMQDLFQENIESARQRAENPAEIWGLRTGFPKFDKKTGGAHRGELIYVVGAPGVGKSWLEVTWGAEFGRQSPGVIISLEMKGTSVSRRTLSGMTGVSTRSMRTGYLGEDDFSKMENAVSEFEGSQIFIDDSSYDTTKLRAVLREMKRDHGITWFFLDYAMLLTDKGKDETDQTKIISANLKRIVADLDLAGIVLHSVTKLGMKRNGEDVQPSMSDQRGSGQAIHDPDVQLFLTPLYDKDSSVTGLRPDEKKKMITIWSTKAREVEEPHFRIHLTRRGESPFFAEYALPF